VNVNFKENGITTVLGNFLRTHLRDAIAHSPNGSR